MPYILKNGVESFEVVDGPLAGRQFIRGRQYAEIPPGEKKKFEEIREPAETKEIPPSPPLKKGGAGLPVRGTQTGAQIGGEK